MPDIHAAARARHAGTWQLRHGGGEYGPAWEPRTFRTLQPLRRQVPVFKAFTGAVATLDVKKTARRVVADSVVTVVAFNIAGLSGIGGLWAENGLRTNPSVQCGPAAACTFPGVCNTI